MAAPFRISRLEDLNVSARSGSAISEGTADFKFYLDRLLKMIPGEVIGLYLIGEGFIPETETTVTAIWALVCLLGVVAIRAYGTADPAEHKSPDWMHVIISCVAFAIWVYTLGGPFEAWGLSVPYIGSLLVLAWTFFVPLLYTGPEEA